jgi:hypothetical protein
MTRAAGAYRAIVTSLQLRTTTESETRRRLRCCCARRVAALQRFRRSPPAWGSSWPSSGPNVSGTARSRLRWSRRNPHRKAVCVVPGRQASSPSSWPVTPEVAGSSPVAPVDSAHLALESRMRRLHRTSPMAENGLRRGKSAGRSRRRPSARASVIRRQQAEFNCPDRRAAKREFRRKTALCADSRGFPTRGGSATACGLPLR